MSRAEEEYRLPDKHFLSLPLLGQYVASLPPGNLADVAKLYLEWTYNRLEIQLLESGCLKHPEFYTWDCCRAHRQVKTVRQDIQTLCLRRFPVRDNSNWGSERYWRSLGMDCRSTEQIVTTTEGFDRHYVRTEINVIIALQFFQRISPDDRRHAFASLYENFLHYQISLASSHHRTPYDKRATDNCCEHHVILTTAWCRLKAEATRLTLTTPHRPYDTWQDYPVLSEDWWTRLVLFWREDAKLITK